MRVSIFLIFFLLFMVLSCDKEPCYRCTQEITKYSNRLIKGYPKKTTTKFFSCGDNIDIVETSRLEIDTVNDTIFSLYINTDCVKK